MKGFFLTIVAIAVIAGIGYAVWSVMNSSGLGHNLGQSQQTENELEK
jgi:hypothetical protein